MKESVAKPMGAAVSGLMLASGLAVAAAPMTGGFQADAVESPDAQAATAAAESAATARTDTGAKTDAAVAGAFSYSQSATTATADISGVFAKAAATLCQNLPTYGCQACTTMKLSGPSASMAATVNDLQAAEGAQSFQMACSCASNVAGGGAIANADVSGAAIATIAQMLRAI